MLVKSIRTVTVTAGLKFVWVHVVTIVTRRSIRTTVEPRLSGPRWLSGLFLWSQFYHEHLLVMIKIRSHILFKTIALNSEVKASLFRFQKWKAVLVCVEYLWPMISGISGRASERGIRRSEVWFLLGTQNFFVPVTRQKTSFSISLPSSKLTISIILFTNLTLSTLLILAVCRTRLTWTS